MDDVIERVRAKAAEEIAKAAERRKRMRAEYPDHAEITDWLRGQGCTAASVCAGDKRFGKRTADAKPPETCCW